MNLYKRISGNTYSLILYTFIILLVLQFPLETYSQKSGNPVIKGPYADPEGHFFKGRFWIYPTYSTPYEKQVFLDAFSSKDLITWEKHPAIIDTSRIKWARKAIWAPSVLEHEQKYYLFFGANDLQRPGSGYWDEKDSSSHRGGIGVAVATQPEGPFTDLLGKPLIDDFHNNAQPIDQQAFKDSDGQVYLIYGGWGHCNMVKLKNDMKGFIPFSDGIIFKEITPENYVEGPFMFRRNNKYYFMWSEGGWTGPDYSVAYAMADHPWGPFKRIGKVLQRDDIVATGAGHNSVLKMEGFDEWYIIYHRRSISEKGRDNREVCIDKMFFDKNGLIIPVIMTNEGVDAIRKTK
jgi:beta-xylosidase